VIKPRRLVPGDRISLVAPASAFKREDLEAGVQELRALGFEAVYDDRLFERHRFVAGSAAVRAAALTDAWTDPTTQAVIAMRGGYGSAQLLPLLRPEVFVAARKVFVGYSDISALLCLHLQHGLTCFHGPMIERRIARGAAGYDRDSFLSAIATADAPRALSPHGLTVLHAGDATGTLVGGTLTQLVALLGTPWAYRPPVGAVLFVEDVAERPYRIHRMLTQLSQAGILDHVAALVFGEFPGCDEPGGDPCIRDVLEDFVAGFRGPVLFGFPSGHTAGPTWTLPLGVRATVRTQPTAALIIEEAAVG
jgi:muramoyltetrapeptide carboxypeptidase